MSGYQWDEGCWITDGYCWNAGIDILQQPRTATGETVVLKPPFHPEHSEPIVCEVYRLSEKELTIAIGTCHSIPVLFCDQISLKNLQTR